MCIPTSNTHMSCGDHTTNSVPPKCVPASWSSPRATDPFLPQVFGAWLSNRTARATADSRNIPPLDGSGPESEQANVDDFFFTDLIAAQGENCGPLSWVSSRVGVRPSCAWVVRFVVPHRRYSARTPS